MGKYNKAVITAKRVVGNKVMYKLEKDEMKEWVEYEDLIQHIDLIIAYEKQRKDMKQTNRKQEINNFNEGEQVHTLEGLDPNEIRHVQFVDKRGGNLLFRVEFSNGQVYQLTNKQLRKLNPILLLDFYEKHVEVGFEL